MFFYGSRLWNIVFVVFIFLVYVSEWEEIENILVLLLCEILGEFVIVMKIIIFIWGFCFY